MAEKVSLVDQIATLDRAAYEADQLFKSGFYRQHPHMLPFEAANLSAAAQTLRFMLKHEQTIRDAISSARALDAAQDVP